MLNLYKSENIAKWFTIYPELLTKACHISFLDNICILEDSVVIVYE